MKILFRDDYLTILKICFKKYPHSSTMKIGPAMVFHTNTLSSLTLYGNLAMVFELFSNRISQRIETLNYWFPKFYVTYRYLYRQVNLFLTISLEMKSITLDKLGYLPSVSVLSSMKFYCQMNVQDPINKIKWENCTKTMVK